MANDRVAASAFAVVLLSVVPAYADPAEFYRGKQVQIIVGYGPGGGYDVYSRLLARHIGAHIPGEPRIVVQNMPGAGSIRAANHIATVAPRDGTAIAAIDRVLPLAAIAGQTAGMQFDPKTLTWIGSLSSYADDAFFLWARKDAPARSVADLRKAGAEPLTVGGIADGSTDGAVVILLRDALRLNLKLIPGYPDSNAAALAVERKEVDARMVGLSSLASSRPDLLGPNSFIQPLVAFGRTTRHPRYPDTPTALELAPDEPTRRMVEVMQIPYRLSRPYISTPDTPTDRSTALRAAFMAATGSAALLEEAQKMKVEISPLDGATITGHVMELAGAPADVMEQIKAMLAESGKR